MISKTISTILSSFVPALAFCFVFTYLGYAAGGKDARLELAEARTEWQEEREKATATALAESEAQRAREKTLTEKLSLAVKDYTDVKTRLAAAAADRRRVDRQLRDARAAITAALNRQGQPATPACIRAADITIASLGGCTGEYRDMAHRYGECLAGMQLIEKTYNAARETCR